MGSTAGSPFTEFATAATCVGSFTRTSRLAGNGLVELRLARLSRPGRLLASARACSGVSGVTDATRESAEKDASTIPSGLRSSKPVVVTIPQP